MIAPAHGLSSEGLHVAAMAVGAWPRRRPKSTTHRKRKDAFIFLNTGNRWLAEDGEEVEEAIIYRGPSGIRGPGQGQALAMNYGLMVFCPWGGPNY